MKCAMLPRASGEHVALSQVQVNIFVVFIYSSDNNCIKNVDYIQIFTGNVTVLQRNLSDYNVNVLINHGYNAVDHFLNKSVVSMISLFDPVCWKLFLSIIAYKLFKLKFEAAIEASQTEPSLHSPSPSIT